MKTIQTYDDFLNESTDVNDPVLVALRASRLEREKSLKNSPKIKNKLSKKRRDELEDQLWEISQDLKDLYQSKSMFFSDMEEEAGEMGLDEFEKQGKHNEYGQELNRVDSEIEKLISKRIQIEKRLAE